MSKTTLVEKEFNDFQVSFQADGWINATAIATKYGKETHAWLRQPDTIEYIALLQANMPTTANSVPHTGLQLVKTTRGRHAGTWLHPKLAVAFARWLDLKFAVWCDIQIDGLLRGKDQWTNARRKAVNLNESSNEFLRMYRIAQGKDTEAHHYSNEARLVNWALTGEFQAVDRDGLTEDQLDTLNHLQMRNAAWISQGVSYDLRKPMLKQYAVDRRVDAAMALDLLTNGN